jgi:hypothetical protein
VPLPIHALAFDTAISSHVAFGACKEPTAVIAIAVTVTAYKYDIIFVDLHYISERRSYGLLQLDAISVVVLRT